VLSGAGEAGAGAGAEGGGQIDFQMADDGIIGFDSLSHWCVWGWCCLYWGCVFPALVKAYMARGGWVYKALI